MPEFAPLAEVVRSGFVEGIHVGHAVIVDPDGAVVASWGDPQAVILPRSANKPAQASAMIRAGLDPERFHFHDDPEPLLVTAREIAAGD